MSGVDPDFDAKITRLLARAFDGFQKLKNIQRLTGGANQETYRIDFFTEHGEHRCALRRAAGGISTQTSDENIGLANEARLIQIAAREGVPVPNIIDLLTQADELGHGFLMQWIEGETRGARIVGEPRFETLRQSLAYQCGYVLGKIHTIDIDRHALDDFLPTRTPRSFIHTTWDRYKALGTPQPMLDYTARWLLDNLPKIDRLALVHNDYRNGNLMLSETEIVAVLDWEVAHLGDPYRDLGWLCTNSWRFGGDKPVGGFGERKDLLAGYVKATGNQVDADDLKFWEVFGSFWWGVGCLMMADQYRHGPDASVERPGIGRRSSECQMDCANLLFFDTLAPIISQPKDDKQLPMDDELLESVATFLRNEVMSETGGRTNFLARVAANSLDIVRRENQLGPMLRKVEHERLQVLLNKQDDLMSLRMALVSEIRDGHIELDNDGLKAHLRATVYGQLAIDQPGYSAYIDATGAS